MTLTAICGRCKSHHVSIEEARNCYLRIAAAIPPPPSVQLFVPITSPQLDYLVDLGEDRAVAARMSKSEASDRIRVLKRNPRPVKNLITSAPNRTQTKVPIQMLRDAIYPGVQGRFAVRADDTQPYTFFRFSMPKSGKFKGCLKIQTQHGPRYELAMAVWPNDKVTVYNASIEDELLLAVVDPNGAKIAYGRELNHCGICGTELTDERSRWYGIGPDCETRYSQIIRLVDDTRGVYRPGRS